jgi:hypothetical protein
MFTIKVKVLFKSQTITKVIKNLIELIEDFLGDFVSIDSFATDDETCRLEEFPVEFSDMLCKHQLHRGLSLQKVIQVNPTALVLLNVSISFSGRRVVLRATQIVRTMPTILLYRIGNGLVRVIILLIAGLYLLCMR